MQATRETILSAIADGPVAGPTLAERLGVSRTAVWKHVEALREAGFEIATGDSGYELVGIPEFGGEAIEFGLEAPFEVEFHESVASTNDRARELATGGAEDVVVVADRQTGGRGRLDREWSSPSGGVWLSLVCRPTAPPGRAPLFTLAAAVAVARAAREAGVDAHIKWPNDVLVDGRKLAGVLTEMEAEADRISWLVVGVGVNANVDPGDLPSDVEATSLRAVRGGDVDRRVFTQRLLEAFHDLLRRPAEVVPAWRDLTATLGRDVRVETANGAVEGRAVDVGDAGALVVRTDEGEVVVAAGDCTHLRPTDT